MELNVISNSKDEMEVEFDSLTLVEILRVYLNKDSSVTFAAWRRDHPTKRPILLVKTKGKNPKKAVEDAIAEIEKELEKADKEFKSMK